MCKFTCRTPLFVALVRACVCVWREGCTVSGKTQHTTKRACAKGQTPRQPDLSNHGLVCVLPRVQADEGDAHSQHLMLGLLTTAYGIVKDFHKAYMCVTQAVNGNTR